MNDNDDIILEEPFASSKEVTEQDLLRFAKLILIVIASIFIFSMILTISLHDKAVFDACKTILPPIATSVIGFYFGKSS